MNTPWGRSDFQEKKADGITFYGTPRHGGIKLSEERNAQVPQYLKDAGFGGKPESGWYEEDVDWGIVALVFPEAFTPEEIETARGIFGYFKPDALARWDRERDFQIELRRQKEAGFVPESSPAILLSKLGKN